MQHCRSQKEANAPIVQAGTARIQGRGRTRIACVAWSRAVAPGDLDGQQHDAQGDERFGAVAPN